MKVYVVSIVRDSDSDGVDENLAVFGNECDAEDYRKKVESENREDGLKDEIFVEEFELGVVPE
jgi:hypothetical protein